MNTKISKLLLISLATLSAACSFEAKKDWAEVTFEIERKTPSFKLFDPNNYSTFASENFYESVLDYDCLAVNVMARDIPNTVEEDEDKIIDYDALFDGDRCETYAGETSQLIEITNGGTASVLVPTGIDRLIQVLALESTIACNTGLNFIDTVEEYGDFEDDELENLFPSMVEVGSTVIDIFGDTELTITSSYSSTNAIDMYDDSCKNSSGDGSPDSYGGLALWYDANDITTSDGTAIASWPSHDGFGPGLVPEGAAPTFREDTQNGNDTVEFTGGSQETINANISGLNTVQGITIFLVVEPHTGMPKQDFVTLSGSTAHGSYSGYDFVRMGTLYGGGPMDRFYFTERELGTGTDHEASPTIIGNFSILTLQGSFMGGSSMRMYVNGNEEASQSPMSYAVAANFNLFELGRTESAQQFDGHIGEVFVYDHEIGDNEREELTCYLSDKWNIPISHNCD